MKLKQCLLGIGVSLVAWCAYAQGPVHYTVLMMDRPAGVQTSAVRADGAHEFTFEYNDRGRGPKLTSIVRLDERGVPIAVENSGRSEEHTSELQSPI